jgi:hypothetical protein
MTAAEQLRLSSAEIERACSLLMTNRGDTLDGCSDVLEAAVERLAALRPVLHEARGDPEALAEAWRLQRNVRRAGVLLANAGEYHTRWTELLGAKTAGYRADGEAAETPRTGRLCLRG